MKIVVLGSRGMLGSDLVSIAGDAGHAVLGLDQPDIDVMSYNNLWRHIPACDWVMNCAAYTNVDRAESHPNDAFAVNAEGARNIAMVCLRKKAKFLHLSTDYVFDGNRHRPYSEKIQPNPVNVYGASKLAGEKNIRAIGCPYIIVRTQSLFGAHGHNFVKAILKMIKQGKKELRIVKDQVSCPTYTIHLAQAIMNLLNTMPKGVVHLSAEGSCSWSDFSKAIVAHVAPEVEVIPIDSSEMDRPAKRPPFSVLDNRLYESLTGSEMPIWEEGLAAYLREIGELS